IYEKWDQLAQEKGLNLIITTFNGGYIGYITPDELYDEHFHEVREMNWYGPGNGQYFDELITRIIQKAGN
ncbi:MAG TPA: alkaline ceramidase, partial [Algoriphagus sp.]|nr:alkaline ceramidase [Algoriphagus sp.]